MISSSNETDPTEKIHMESINKQFMLGIENLLSGVLTSHLTSIQQHHINTYNVGKFTSILSWSRNVIRLLLDHSNSLWQYRSKILHDDNLLTREATLRNQAIALLNEYKQTPHKIAYEQREYLNRSVTYFKTTHLRNVRSWLNRMSVAIETEANRIKNGRTDIRRWTVKKKDITMESSTVGNENPETIILPDLSSNILTLTKNPAPN